MRKRVIIIGGGFSGLAAGVALSQHGHDLLLFERRNHLGGRAYSLTDAKTGDTVDNGQHLFMACYRHTIAFLEKIGCLDRLKFQERLKVEFLDRSRDSATFECADLPAPMHVLAGLFKMRGITLGDKLRAINVGRAIRRSKPTGQNHLTVSRWLDRLKQSDRMRERFWYPMAIATLNETPELASAKMMKRVLEEAFGAEASGSGLGIARVGLSDLYTQGARDYIESCGGRIRTGAQVAKLKIVNGRAIAVDLKDGERIEADCFISAVPPAAFLKMLPDELRAGEFAHLAALGSSPIVSINLWFDRPIIDCEFVGLLGTRIQWLFNKDLILSPEKESNQIAIVISAARRFVDWTKQDLVEMALAELHEVIPQSRSVRLLHSVVVKEREATIAHTVESDSLRPGARTSIPNLLLAGDWTNTGLPATIESAVMSGHIAAENVGRD